MFRCQGGYGGLRPPVYSRQRPGVPEPRYSKMGGDERHAICPVLCSDPGSVDVRPGGRLTQECSGRGQGNALLVVIKECMGWPSG